MQDIAEKVDLKPALDVIEAIMVECEPVEFDVVHTFTPGLYSRSIYMPAGTTFTSKVHRTEHQFVVLQGKLKVFNLLDNSITDIEAPYHGITYPGTRRLLEIYEDTVWITFHKTDKTTVEEVEEEILEPYTNSVIGSNILKGEEKWLLQQ